MLGGRISKDALQGRVALVGMSRTAFASARPTPLDRSCPAVEIQAAAMDAILRGNSIIVPSWAPVAQLGLILFAGISLVCAFLCSRIRTISVVALGCFVVLFCLPLLLFNRGFFVSPLYGVATCAVLCVLHLVMRWRQDREERSRMRSMFSRYVCPEVLNQITENVEQLGSGRKKLVTIMFTDIRGFAALSKDRDAQEIVKLLNLYFTPMVEIVRKHAGTTDKIIGDGLMVYWNAPLERSDHAIKAVKAALDMQDALPLLNRELEKELNLEQSIRVSIGVHAGEAFVGNMGPDFFASYTLIGDNVNLAARLTGLGSQYETGIVVSEDVRNACGDAFFFQPLDSVIVRGRDDLPVSIYTPIRWEAARERREELDAWEAAWLKYVGGDFAVARAEFAVLHGQYPHVDLYRVFVERMASLPEKAPENWSGTWIAAEK